MDDRGHPSTLASYEVVVQLEKGNDVVTRTPFRLSFVLHHTQCKIMNVLDDKTRRIMAASYALPNLETAVQQVIHNAIDARAKKLKLSVDIANASFSAVDDGCGIRPDHFYTYVGECYASSKRSTSNMTDEAQIQQKPYGSRGAFLYELTSLATTVEIESRVQEHWTCYRKVFKEGAVVFNARSKSLCKTPGTKINVSNLFGRLPVRRKYLSRNIKYRSRVMQRIQSFCVSMSMIWPSVSFDIQFQGAKVRPVSIPAAPSCRKRFLEHFGHLLGNQLQYVSFSSETSPFLVRGYVALIPDASEAMGYGIKQAKSYYQFAFFGNEWEEECQQICSRTITEAALELASAIPIFVLKIEAANDQFDTCGIGRKERVWFKAPDEFRQFLYTFVQKLTTVEANRVKIQESSPNEVVPHPASSDQSAYDSCPNDFDAMQMSPSLSLDDLEHFQSFDDDAHKSVDPSSQYDESFVLDAADNSAMWSSPSRSCNMCQTFSHVNNDSKNIGFDDNDQIFCQELHGSNAAAYQVSNASLDFGDCHTANFAQDSAGIKTSEDDLDDVFFSHEPSSSQFATLTRAVDGVENEEIWPSARPWLSSKPDAYDCADFLLDLCQENVNNENAHQVEHTRHLEGRSQQHTRNSQLQLVVSEQAYDKNNACPPLHIPAVVGSSSNYFSMRTVGPSANKCLRRWHGSKVDPVKHLAAALHVDNIQVFGGDRTIKINKSTLAKMEVIRQVDCKFILVRADTCRGKLLLCIDQHAADERILLEKLETEMFGRDGSLRQVEVHEHNPPLILQLNPKERAALQQNEELVKDWGFEFVFISPKPEQAFVNARTSTASHTRDRVVLYTTPKVEKRVSNTDDFRDFLQLLSSAEETYLHSRIRPPVITRLLHSRACRSAIMFGDRLSLTQCEELIAELKMCQLPFQCAHGRPSVVPLAEICHGNTNEHFART